MSEEEKIPAPHLWRATLRDGTIVVKGDHCKGVKVNSPIHLPVGGVAKMELLPAIEGAKWMRLSLDLAEGEVLDYVKVRDYEMSSSGPVDFTDEPFKYGAVRLGAIDGEAKCSQCGIKALEHDRGGSLPCNLFKPPPGSRRRTKWALPDGNVVLFEGSQEEGIRSGVLPKAARPATEQEIDRAKAQARRERLLKADADRATRIAREDVADLRTILGADDPLFKKPDDGGK